MFVSAFGGVIFLLRKSGYDAKIRVEDPDREKLATEAIVKAPPEAWPSPWRGLWVGFSAGVLAGMLIGLAEALAISSSSAGATGARVFLYGPFTYGVFCAAFGAGLGFATALSGRWMKRQALPEKEAFGYFVAAIFGLFAFALGVFRIRRDFFHEELVWKSAVGLAVLLGCAFVVSGVSAILARGIRWLVQRGPFGRLVQAPTAVALLAVVGVGLGVNIAMGDRVSRAGTTADKGQHAGNANNILFIVIDTVRADHLPAYGYDAGSTPNLDRFAEDAVRFDQAFTNSSWTRPSFASILTGRLPSSHGVMAKSDALPDSLTTLPEALKPHG